MKKEYLTILTNIIGGVESGGQTYGKRKYGAYAGKAANADNEKTCTLGWAQNYGNEGRRLCQMILKADPKAFRNRKETVSRLGSYKMESDSKRKSCIDCDYHNGCRKEVSG